MNDRVARSTGYLQRDASQIERAVDSPLSTSGPALQLSALDHADRREPGCFGGPLERCVPPEHEKNLGVELRSESAKG
jgi:hypothetical protein